MKNEKAPTPQFSSVCRTALGNHPQIVRQLLAAGADPSLVDKQGRTACEIAKVQNHLAVVRVFEEFTSAPGEHPSD
jgi:ankyrin repeat protein